MDHPYQLTFDDLQNRVKIALRQWHTDTGKPSPFAPLHLFQQLRHAQHISGHISESVLEEFLRCLVNPVIEGEFCEALVDLGIITAVEGENGERKMEQQFIPVAAAGNLPRNTMPDYPYAPALWDSVVSISAVEALPGRSSSYTSNFGEIAMRGLHPSAIDEHGEPRQGTSFAAPRFSVWAAMYLLTGGPSPCEEGDDHYPVLGYKKDNWNIQDWPHDPNLSLMEAAEFYCPGFRKLKDLGWPMDTDADTATSTDIDWLPQP